MSGRYYSPDGLLQTALTGAAAAGTIALSPGYIRKQVSVSALLVRVTTAAASSNAQISLYASSPTTGCPTGAPLFTSASQATTATGAIEVACSLSLAPGTYWLAIQKDNATPAFLGVSNNTNGAPSLIGSATSATVVQQSANLVGLSKAGTFGTWPTLTGNISTDSLTEVSAGVPAWAFKVS